MTDRDCMPNHCQLYLITPPRIDDLEAFAKSFDAVLKAGHGTPAQIACVQLRLKDVSDDVVLKAAEKLLPISHKYEAAFLINDRPDLAKKAGADGVHVGQSDASYEEARALLGDDASIGVTCHASTHLAMEAGEAGAEYVAFGAFFQTDTKETSVTALPDILTFWSQVTTVPCVAIGGINPQNASVLVEAGADFLAVSGAIWNHAEGPEVAMKEFAEILAK